MFSLIVFTILGLKMPDRLNANGQVISEDTKRREVMKSMIYKNAIKAVLAIVWF
jgi:hypothetical protein